MNYNTTVNPDVHTIVVIIEDTHLGFTALSKAVLFIEEVYSSEEAAKLFNLIATAMSDDKDDNFKIFSMEEYVDLYLDEDSTDEDE